MDGQAGHVDGLLVFSGDRKIITRRPNISVEHPTFLTGKPHIPLVLLAQGLVFSWRFFSRIISTVQFFIYGYTVTRVLTSSYADIIETEKYVVFIN